MNTKNGDALVYLKAFCDSLPDVQKSAAHYLKQCCKNLELVEQEQ